MQSPASVVPKVVAAADVESTVGLSALPLRYPLRRLRVDQIELSPSLSRRPTCTGQTFALVGTGHMGASIGLALKRAGATVLGVDSNPAHLVRSLELGAIDRDTDLDSGDRGAITAFFEDPASLLARFLPDPDQPRGYVRKG